MKDRINHFFAGALIASAVGLPPYLESLNLFAGLWSAITSGIIAASMKEYFDYHINGNRWDWWDWGCTVIGAILVANLYGVGYIETRACGICKIVQSEFNAFSAGGGNSHPGAAGQQRMGEYMARIMLNNL